MARQPKLLGSRDCHPRPDSLAQSVRKFAQATASAHDAPRITEFRTSAIQQFLNRPNATPYGALKTRTFADILEVEDELKQRTFADIVPDRVWSRRRYRLPHLCTERLSFETDVEHTENRTLKRH
jgi:hypothetical protein